MSEAAKDFDESIKDAEELLTHFDAINANPPPPNAEVLKRAALIMAFAAWETYVKERALEAVTLRLQGTDEGPPTRFMLKKFEEETKRFYNPNVARTQKLFVDFMEIDVTKSWEWNGKDTEKTKKLLDEWLAKRNDAAHRSRSFLKKTQTGHLIKREDLVKMIKFLRNLVQKTDGALNAGEVVSKDSGDFRR